MAALLTQEQWQDLVEREDGGVRSKVTVAEIAQLFDLVRASSAFPMLSADPRFAKLFDLVRASSAFSTLSGDPRFGRVVEDMEEYHPYDTYLAVLVNQEREEFSQDKARAKVLALARSMHAYDEMIAEFGGLPEGPFVVASALEHRVHELQGHAKVDVMYHKQGYLFAGHHLVNSDASKGYHRIYVPLATGKLTYMGLDFSCELPGMILYTKALAIFRNAMDRALDRALNRMEFSWVGSFSSSWSFEGKLKLEICDHEFKDIYWEIDGDQQNLSITCLKCGKKKTILFKITGQLNQ